MVLAFPKPDNEDEHRLESLFPLWASMPVGERIYPALARRAQVQLGPLVKHAQKFLWAERVRELNAASDALTNSAIEQSRAKVVMRQLSTLARIRDKALKVMEDGPPLEPKDAAKIVLETIRLEREIMGMNETRHQDADQAFRDEKLAEIKKLQQRELTAGHIQDAEFKLNPDLAAEPLVDPDSPDTPEEETEPSDDTPTLTDEPDHSSTPE